MVEVVIGKGKPKNVDESNNNHPVGKKVLARHMSSKEKGGKASLVGS